MIKEERRKKRRAQKIRIIILVVALVLLLLVLIVAKVFVVKEVEVEGNVLYDEQLITDTILNDEYSWNSLYVLTKYTFVDAEPIPFIDTMEVSLVHPQKLNIRVYEKGLIGYVYVAALGENVYFDKDGLVVEISTRVIEDIPQMEGIACEEVVLHEKLPIEEQLLRQLLTLTQALKRAELEPDVINYNMQSDPVLYYGDVVVRMGSTENLTLKVEHLSKILPSLEGMTGVLHMEGWTEESKNIIFEKSLAVEEPSTEVTEDTEAESESETEASE